MTGARRHARVVRGDDLERPSVEYGPRRLPPLLLLCGVRRRLFHGFFLVLGPRGATTPAASPSETVRSTDERKNDGADGRGTASRLPAGGPRTASDPRGVLAGPTRRPGPTPLSRGPRRQSGRVPHHCGRRAVRCPRGAGLAALWAVDLHIHRVRFGTRARPRADLAPRTSARHLQAVSHGRGHAHRPVSGL